MRSSNLAQSLPNEQPDWGQVGVFLSMAAAAATGAWTWWKNNGPGKKPVDKEETDKKAREDPDLFTIEGLKGIVLTLQTENARLVRENERLWDRQGKLEDFILKIQRRETERDKANGNS